MASFFVDLDGTIVRFGTDEPLPGALERLRELSAHGHQIIFTTYRHMLTPQIRAVLQSVTPDPKVLLSVHSPRVVINDDGAVAINHPRNAAWGDCSELKNLPTS